MNPIASIDQITPEWLTQALRQNGNLHKGHVVSINSPDDEANPLGGPGFNSSNRLVVEYSPGADPTAPKRLYLKAEPQVLHKGSGQREVDFYRLVAAQMPYPPAPKCYDFAYDPESGAYHLLLEDVTGTHRTVHPEEPARLKDIYQMLDALASLHAFWWGNEQLGQDIGSISSFDEIQATFSILQNHFGDYVDFLGDRLSSRRKRIYEIVLDRYPNVLARRLALRGMLTLVHDDAHAGNFLLPFRHPRQRAYLIDWQQWDVQVGLHDVAYLIALFWYPERRKRMELKAVKRYHRQLQSYGVSGYDWPACWADYRLQAIGNLLVPYWAWIFQGANWGYHRWHQLEKAMLAFQDLKCVDVLG